MHVYGKYYSQYTPSINDGWYTLQIYTEAMIGICFALNIITELEYFDSINRSKDISFYMARIKTLKENIKSP